MNLQNIIINFTDSTVSTMFEDKHYSINAIERIGSYAITELVGGTIIENSNIE